MHCFTLLLFPSVYLVSVEFSRPCFLICSKNFICLFLFLFFLRLPHYSHFLTMLFLAFTRRTASLASSLFFICNEIAQHSVYKRLNIAQQFSTPIFFVSNKIFLSLHSLLSFWKTPFTISILFRFSVSHLLSSVTHNFLCLLDFDVPIVQLTPWAAFIVDDHQQLTFSSCFPLLPCLRVLSVSSQWLP